MTFEVEHPGQNPTFNGNGPSWANACVGDNGSPQILDYAQGFVRNVDILLGKVIADRGDYVDELIYPICFAMRHAVELYLKSTAQQFVKMAGYREKSIVFNLDGSHHIGKIWQHIVENSASIDRRYAPLVAELTPYIDDLAGVDATGQVFRYAFSSENNKHLTDLAVINILVLKNRFGELIRLLTRLDLLNYHLDAEYGLGTFTKDLSRSDLVDIASMLPQRAQWAEPIFDEAKAVIKAKYHLGSQSFTEALRVIQKNPEMAQIIGAPVELPDFPLPTVFALLDAWIERLGPKLERTKSREIVSSGSDEFGESILASLREDHAAWEKVKEHLTPDVFAQIKAVHSIGYEEVKCELHPRFLESYQIVLRRAFDSEGNQFRDAVMHVMRKSRIVQNIILGLKSLGQNALAGEIEHRYRTWLTAAETKHF